MKLRAIKLSAVLLISTFGLQSCLADIRTGLVKNEGVNNTSTVKGKAILESAWKKQGLDKLAQHKVYSFTGNDTWKGAMGKMGKIWPNSIASLNFRYQIGTFDGQVQFLDGDRKDETVGLQNWNYYVIGKDTTFQDQNKRHVFGIAAFQYFSEMLDRLRNAPIISYAGESEFRGQTYDLVFCTWHQEKAHQEADQYIAWINKKTGMMEFTQYTIRENYLKMPGYKAFYGGVEFSNFKSVDGIMIPHEHTIYVLDLKKNKTKFLHQLKIKEFNFDNFDAEELILDKSIKTGGDYK